MAAILKIFKGKRSALTGIALLFCLFLMTTCRKKNHEAENLVPGPSVYEVISVSAAAHSKFFEFANATNGDIVKSLEMTRDWLLTDEKVKSAEVFDSSYLRILMKSGLLTTYCIYRTDDSGRSIFRGPASGSGKLSVYTSQAMMAMGSSSGSKKIVNKNVLLFAPGYSEFHYNSSGLLEKIAKRFTDKDNAFKVTIMKDLICTYDKIQFFGNYGMVIIDTHGLPDGFMIGTEIKLNPLPKDEEAFNKVITDLGGPDMLAMIQNGNLGISTSYGVDTKKASWYQVSQPQVVHSLYVTSKYINSMPQWPGTVIFGNMCYSAANNVYGPRELYNTPLIRQAFISRGLISYYGYSRDNDYSNKVTDDLSKQMEDSLTKSFILEGDSTGNAHLDQNGNEFNDKSHIKELKLKHYLADNYFYGGCGDDLLDDRDGQVYKTVCIGKQVWMAQNLNYKDSGGYCYENNPANCALYGRLYDWATVMGRAKSSSSIPSGVRGICPKGWHIPSDNEWIALVDYLGGVNVAGGKLKSVQGWDSPNTGATDAFKLALLPGGGGADAATFNNKGIAGYWWSATEFNSPPGYALNRAAQNVYTSFYSQSTKKEFMLSCRCVKD